ncbi:chromosome partitioning protein [Glutamicibacter uratoxydans]|uniref:non-specific protein-tyrosine kinase n=1 Tax=Glutamicibacter uratoxydans TaxID=43667 RepID=A0A4Y4DSJ2_GLUUR|nr:polysaccharide biosynthesis tyrosine autokinase [Glutamicibacter uratoxydans]GED07876.1 chromosome partitioning protein [Glutamicibacter uratoxydans]
MELKDYWRIFRAHWIAVVAITVVGGLVGVGWAFAQPKVYAASASGLLTTGVNSDISKATIGESYAKSRIKSYLDIAKSTTVANLAAEQLGIDVPADSLLRQITVTNPIDTATMKVTAEADSAEGSRDLAAAWIDAIGQQVSEIENADVSAKDEGASIVSFRSLDSALLPQEPISPNKKLSLLIGLLIGAAIAIGYALLRNIFDRRVHSIEEVERETNMSVIGTIPFHNGFTSEHRMLESTGGNDRSEKGREEYAIAEALRELRTNLQFMSIDNPPRKIVITSALPSEGKSTLIANLASTIAASGQNVVVIDGDLRRPMVAKTFGLLEGVGLTDVLIGRARLTDVLQAHGNSGKLFVLGAGKIPPNPSELLASKALHDIIDDLAEHAIVLIDAPPLLPVTDAAILTARTDGALIVTRANRTTYDELKAALENVTKVNGCILGIIINGVSGKGQISDGYGYRYRSYYGQIQEPETTTGAIPIDDFDNILQKHQSNVEGLAETTNSETSDYLEIPQVRRGRRVSDS